VSGIHASTGALLARQGLEREIRAALADEREVDVSAGFSWPMRFHDWVALGNVRATRDAATIGPRRQQQETLTIDVNIGAWRPGSGSAIAEAAWGRAFQLLALIEAHLLTGDNTTLGGAVLWCLPGDTDTTGDDYDDGYQVEIAATFVCSHRTRAT
jgi:hypothetical protein